MRIVNQKDMTLNRTTPQDELAANRSVLELDGCTFRFDMLPR
jgi:hypothetical protein